jgi:alpha-galactosidase
MPNLSRRRFAALAAAAAVPAMAASKSIQQAPGRVILDDGTTAPPSGADLTRRWNGNLCQSSLRNTVRTPLRVHEVVLFAHDLDLPPDTPLYGESFQMLSQTSGTLAAPADLGYSELQHYKIPQPPDARSMFGMTLFSPPGAPHQLYAFTSSKRFAGRFYLRPSKLEVVIDTEGLTLAPGESWEFEEFLYTTGPDSNALLDQLAKRIAVHHPPIRPKRPPAGWCSWYCFGPRVTAQNVLDNLDVIAKTIPDLRYIQIDDGYQSAMGDWLETGKAFDGDVRKVLAEIRKRGFEPAIWVAPFIAEAGSNVFKQHPQWFIQDVEGQPLSSERVTFKGWRRGPWYALDGTHPEAQEHLASLFRTMRNEWGCTYFKLDANFWGAMHGGRFHDPKATRVEAYRRGMEAILKGVGDSFILGCNHPVWASFGLIHGSRSSDDISRRWDRFTRVARQNLSRNWQNERLWWNDPDCVVLTGTLPEEEFRFHATAAFASGGMMLSGDDLTQITPERLAMLRRMVPAGGVAARFEDRSLRVGHIRVADRAMIAVLNWEARPAEVPVTLPSSPTRVLEVWTGADHGTQRGRFTLAMPAHSGRLLQLA